MNFVNGAVVLARTDIYAEELLFGLQLLHSMWTRILREEQNVPVHFFPDVRTEFANGSLRGGSDLKAVGQDLISEFLHEVTERPRAFFRRFPQGRSAFLQIPAVQLFLGQTLQ